IAPSRAWAADLKAFTTAEGATLMAVARTIAPHDKLEDAAYAIVIQNIDGDALKDGVTALGPGFATAPENVRVAALKKVEQTPFFQTMRVKVLGVLYATEMAYTY